MRLAVVVLCSLLGFCAHSQPNIQFNPFGNKERNDKKSARKLMQKNHGAIIGLQKGGGTTFELGYEAHWRKMSLSNPAIYGATTNMEYDVSNNLVGYRAGMWMKKGRVNLTYGGNLVYFNNLNGQHKYGLAPAVGFRLAGFHFLNSYNLLAGDDEVKANTLTVSMRYYFPVDNKFTWDRKTLKRKKQRQKKKDKKKAARAKERETKTGIKKLLHF
jgi:hypothetical protein